MRVLQLTDLHLGPEDHPDAFNRAANIVAWDNARRIAGLLREEPDAQELVIVITGDLTDAGHIHPEELRPVAAWLETLPGRVLALPGNHDVGNFVSSTARPTVSSAYIQQWREHVGLDRFSHAADGHRLLGLNSMILGSDLPEASSQNHWLDEQLDQAQIAGESVWVFLHAPLFLRERDEVCEPREHYWCPAAPARDRMLARLDHPSVRGLFHGHVHRRFDHHHHGVLHRACPALSGTHTEADYFPRDHDVHRHDLSELIVDANRVELGWQPAGLTTTIRYVG